MEYGCYLGFTQNDSVVYKIGKNKVLLNLKKE